MIRPTILILAALSAVPLCAGTVSIEAAANSQLNESAPDIVWSDWGATGGSLLIINYMPQQEASDIFQFSLASLPSGSTITGAKLWLYDTGWNDANYYPLYWHPDSSWSEGSVTWNNFSTTNNVLAGSRTGSAGWGYNAWNIDVGAWGWAADVAQGAATFQLREGFGSFSHNQNNFYSRLAPLLDTGESVRPYLELEYNGGGSSQTPEPGTFALMGAGILVAAGIRAKRSRA